LVDKGIEVDYNKMIKNNFTKKLQGILEIINKENLLTKKLNLDNLFGG
jgi:hypothetical protein